MGWLTARIARLPARSRRSPWRVVLAWLMFGALVWVAGSAAGGESTDEISVPGSDSAAAVTMAERTGFSSGVGLSATVVFRTERGSLTDPVRANAIEVALANAITEDGPTSVANPFVPGRMSKDGTVAFAELRFERGPPDVHDFDRLGRIADELEPAGIRAEFGGTLADVVSDPEPSAVEFVGIAIALVVLAWALRSPRAAFVVLVSAGVGVAVAMGGVLWLSSVVKVPGYAQQMAALVGLGVGIDYGLLLLSRIAAAHRSNASGEDTDSDDVREAERTATTAIALAGGSVVVSMCGLFVLGIPFFSAMGLATALSVVAVVAASLTLLPALVTLTGGPPRSAWVARSSERHERFVARVIGRPFVVLIVGLVAAGVLAAPVLVLRLGQLDAGSADRAETRRQAHDLMVDNLGPGFGDPLTISMDLLDAVPWESQENAERATKAALSVAAIDVAFEPDWGHEGEQVAITVIPKMSGDSPKAPQMLRDLRSTVTEALDGTGAEVHIGGAAATRIDLSQRVAQRLWLMIALVVGLSLVLLAWSWRAPLIALKAALLNGVSVAAAYGVLVAVFQWGWGASLIGLSGSVPIDPIVPVFLFAILFGLSMDYEVFLIGSVLDRVRRGERDTDAIARGLADTWRVVGVAAVIMTAVFSGFIFAADPLTKMFGIGLTAAVVVDATIARGLLVPSALALLRRWGWGSAGKASSGTAGEH